MPSYFFDSYAIIELLQGNPNYAKYIHEPVRITLFNLVEIYWFALREYGENIAEQIYQKYKSAVFEISDETIKKAVKFREKYKKRNLSYADSLGYFYALDNNLIFLTGDKEFEDMEKVEFVK